MNIKFLFMVAITLTCITTLPMKRELEDKQEPVSKVAKIEEAKPVTEQEAAILLNKLIFAIKNNQIDTVKELLDRGADVNGLEQSGNLPLMVALDKGSAPMIKLLVQRGADLNKRNLQGHSALDSAMDGQNTEPRYEFMRKHYKDALDIFLEASPDEPKLKKVIFFSAINRGNVFLVRKCIDEGMVITGDALELALIKHVKKIVLMLIDKLSEEKEDKSITKRGLIAIAIAKKESEHALLLIQASVNDPKIVGSALELAVFTGQHELVQKILKIAPNSLQLIDGNLLYVAIKNRDIPMVEIILGAKVPVGELEMQQAVESSNEPIIDMLIKASTDKQKALDGTLLKAAAKGNVSLLSKLLDWGAKVDVKGENDWTALHYAAAQGNKKAIELLIEKGAPINAQSKDSETPLWLVLDSNLKDAQEIVQLLCKNGASGYIQANVKYNLWPDSDGPSEDSLDALELAVEDGNFEILNTFIRVQALSPADAPSLLERVNRKLCLFLNNNNQIYDMAHKHSFTSFKDQLFYNALKQKNYEDTSLLLKQYLGRIEDDLDLTSYMKNPQETCKEIIQAWQGRENSRFLTFRSIGFSQTTLMLACIVGDSENVRRLLEVGFPCWYINAQDIYGRTALIYAILYGHFDIAYLLISYCAKSDTCIHSDDRKQKHNGLNLMDGRGDTALMYAIKKNNAGLIGELLKNNADFISEQQIAAALKIATEKGSKEIMLMLLGRFAGNEKLFSVAFSWIMGQQSSKK